MRIVHLTDEEFDVLRSILDFHCDDEPFENGKHPYNREAFETMYKKVEEQANETR
jgi:hypothetical protein